MHFHSELKHTAHVNKLTSSSYHTLHNISRVRHLLDKLTTQTLIQALVLSRLDYCNSILLGTPKYNIQKIQRIQNMACRLINQLPRHSRVSDYMKNLHWLKIPERIEYKVLTIMYKCIHNSALQYLQELVIQDRSHNRSLRSVTNNKLLTTLSRLTLVHKSSFRSQGPRLWNNLPNDIVAAEDIAVFKAKLKTHLFPRSYP